MVLGLFVALGAACGSDNNGDVWPTGDTATDASSDAYVDADTIDGDTADADADAGGDTGDVTVLSGAPLALALLEDAPFVMSHPLIFEDRIYVHTASAHDSINNGLGGVTERLTCYDFETLDVVWSTVLTEDGSTFGVVPSEMGTVLNRYGDVIPVWSMGSDADRVMLTSVDVYTGEIARQREIPMSWTYIAPNGEPVVRSVGRLADHPVQSGSGMFLAAGTSVDICSGDVDWDSGPWTTMSDAVVHRGVAYGHESGGGRQVTALALGYARAELTGYADDGTARLWTSEGQGDVDGSYGVALWNGSVVSVDEHQGSAALDAGIYVNRWDMRTGALVSRIALAPREDFSELSLMRLNDSGLRGYMQISGDILLIPLTGLMTVDRDSRMAAGVRAVDLATEEELYSVMWPSMAGNFVASGDYFYGLRAVLDAGEHGFSVLQYDIRTGALVAEFSDPSYTDGSYTPAPAVYDFGTQRQPLLSNGRLVVVADNPDQGSAVWLIDTGDTSAEVRQFRNNNQMNPVLNLADPTSEQGPNVSAPMPGDPEDTTVSNLEEVQPRSTVERVDTLPTLTLDEAVLAAMGATEDDLDAWPTSYVARLRDVAYSQTGEEDAGNRGEAYLQVETELACGRNEVRYPSEGFVGLYNVAGNPLLGTEGRNLLGFDPDLPVYFEQLQRVESAGGDLILRFSALEDDTPDGIFEVFMYWLNSAASLAVAIAFGDYCDVVTHVLGSIEREASEHTQHFGSPFALVSPDTVGGSLYGIPSGAHVGHLPVAGSSTPSLLVAAQTLAGVACVTSSLLNGDVFELDNVLTTTLESLDPADTASKGDWLLELRRELPISELTVELMGLTGSADNALVTGRVGILGYDPLGRAPEAPLDVFQTPFVSLSALPSARVEVDAEDTAVVLVDTTFSGSGEGRGTAAVYLELQIHPLFPVGLGQPDIPGVPAIWSSTRFFDDALFGAWEATDDPQVFRKEVVMPIDSTSFVGGVTLAYTITLDTL